jgi:hypothetical protein
MGAVAGTQEGCASDSGSADAQDLECATAVHIVEDVL